jgi:putative peptide zinc metalloprotease protein
MTDFSRPFANPLLEVSVFDSDATRSMALCAVPTQEGHVRFAIPSEYMDLVREFDGRRDADEAIDAYIARTPGAPAKEWLRRLVEQSLIPKGILIHAHQDPGSAGVSKQSKLAFLYIKLPIIGPGIVDPIARRLGFLFQRKALLAGLLLFVAMHVYVYAFLVGDQRLDFNRLNAGDVLILMLFSTLATVMHEFGHASAAAYHGCRRMTIGWGLYLIYTVLWTNVSDAWKLPRRQRALVDIGGVYFESFFLLAMLCAYLYSGEAIYLFAFIFIDLSIAMTFNPFLRMDGYWLVSDIFGIVNLRKQQLIWTQELAARMLGKQAPAVRSDLSRRAKWALGIYTLLGVVFLGYILTVIYKFMVLNVLSEYPAMVSQYWNDLRAGMTLLQAGKDFLEIFWRSLMLFGATVTLLSLCRSVIMLVTSIARIRMAAPQRA